MYNIFLTIGDWAEDGHGLNTQYLICSDKPVEEVREAHFKIKETTAIDIENICSAYDDNHLDDATIQKLKDAGYNVDSKLNETEIIDAYAMSRIWVFLLNKTDPSLNLRFATTPTDTPSLHFYGKDNMGRHIGSVGYGVMR